MTTGAARPTVQPCLNLPPFLWAGERLDLLDCCYVVEEDTQQKTPQRGLQRKDALPNEQEGLRPLRDDGSPADRGRVGLCRSSAAQLQSGR